MVTSAEASEKARIAFVIARDGIYEAKAWALRTAKIYRSAVLQNGKNGGKTHYASTREFKREFIQSYLILKRFALTRNDI